MGFLSIDHRGGQDIDEKKGNLAEFDTITCAHCTTLIAVLKRATETVHLTNCDIAAGAKVAPHLTHEYTAKFTCRKCKKPVCRECAKLVTAGGGCNPVAKAVDEFFRKRDRKE